MIKDFEYAVAKGFLREENVSLLNSEFSSAFGDLKFSKIHPNVVQFSVEQVESSDVLSRTSRQIISHFTDTLETSGIVLSKVWL